MLRKRDFAHFGRETESPYGFMNSGKTWNMYTMSAASIDCILGQLSKFESTKKKFCSKTGPQ